MNNIPQDHKPPSMKLLQSLVTNGDTEMFNDYVKKFNLNVEIIGGKVVDKSDTTEAWLMRFITVHEDMLKLKDDVRKLSRVDDEVLITGETGTGKELIARALHGRREGKFIALNCAGLPEGLVESELFGSVAGAYTDSKTTTTGLMQTAMKGTLFLDEIGELAITVQAKLLRALQERKIRRVGGTQELDISCRIVCATHRNIRKMVEEGVFRMDLYARISTFELHTLPLFNRKDDIKLIVESIEGGKEFITACGDKFQSQFMDYSLNVRSLQQYVKRYKVLGRLP